MRHFYTFIRRSAAEAFTGGPLYMAWVGFLFILSLLGLNAYCQQFAHGMVTTGLTDQVSWGVYISNFTFLVGMAAAAVMLVIPVYVYKDGALRDVVIFGELLAIASIIMCLMFVMVDMGRPLVSWHLMPGIGRFNWPFSMLTWDVIVLNGYLLLNMHVAGYMIYSIYRGRTPRKILYLPFVFIAIVWAISIHTVTAFLYVGLGGRPFWNSAIVAPRFLASAFTSGPAFLILTLQIVRRYTRYSIKDAALLKLRTVIQVAMIINVFLFLCEVFTEFYTDSAHTTSARYLFFGLHGYHGLVWWIWPALILNLTALALLILPATRAMRYLNVACVMAVMGIWIEKGMGLVVPAFIPTPLGEVVEYTPTLSETLISWGIWAFGLMFYTMLVKVAVPILRGTLQAEDAPPRSQRVGLYHAIESRPGTASGA